MAVEHHFLVRKLCLVKCLEEAVCRTRLLAVVERFEQRFHVLSLCRLRYEQHRTK